MSFVIIWKHVLLFDNRVNFFVFINDHKLMVLYRRDKNTTNLLEVSEVDLLMLMVVLNDLLQ